MIRYSPGVEFWSEPMSTLRRIQEEMNRTLGDSRWGATSEFPAVNIWRGENGVLVTAEIPGVTLEDIDLTVHQNTLTIKGKRAVEAQEPEVSFHRQERNYGSFARTIALPYGVDPEHVQARAQNGILTIQLPRPEVDKPQRITITAG